MCLLLLNCTLQNRQDAKFYVVYFTTLKKQIAGCLENLWGVHRRRNGEGRQGWLHHKGSFLPRPEGCWPGQLCPWTCSLRAPLPMPPSPRNTPPHFSLSWAGGDGTELAAAPVLEADQALTCLAAPRVLSKGVQSAPKPQGEVGTQPPASWLDEWRPSCVTAEA